MQPLLRNLSHTYNLEKLKKAKMSVPVGEVPVVKEIAVKIRGCPHLVGEFDSDVQTYIKALRKALL